MKITQLSSAANGGANVHTNGDVTDIVIMDGASSVADRDYIDRDLGDVVWFVQNFAVALGRVIGQNQPPQAESVLRALSDLRATFEETTAGRQIPAYALPIAAMTWIRARKSDCGHTLDLYCLGDCETFLLRPGQGVVDHRVSRELIRVPFQRLHLAAGAHFSFDVEEADGTHRRPGRPNRSRRQARTRTCARPSDSSGGSGCR